MPQPRHPHPLHLSEPVDVYRQPGFQCDLCCQTFYNGLMYHCERIGCVYDECPACHEASIEDTEEDVGGGVGADVGAGLGLGSGAGVGIGMQP